MSGSLSINTLMDSTIRSNQNLSTALVDLGRYRRLLGKLIYLEVTRSNITFVVGLLSRYMQSPHYLHLDAACRVAQYLKGAPSRGFFYQPYSHLNIARYSDADQVDDLIDRRSISGYCTFMGCNLVICLVRSR